MRTNLISAKAANRRRVGLIAGLTATTALAVTAVAGSPAFATDEAAAATITKVDNNMWAIVDGETGGLFESDGHVTTSFKLFHTLSGQGYRINFDRDIRQCSYVATPTASTPGEIVDADTGIAIVQNDSFPKQLDVITKAGAGEDPFFDASSFSLMVQCR